MTMTPRTTVRVAGLRGSAEVDAIIDTGFDGNLCLPILTAVQIGLELRDHTIVELADGSQKRELVFGGQVEFQGESRAVSILLTESSDALIGTELLSKCRLTVDFVTGRILIVQSRRRRRDRGQ
jgi:clan AA aspartic protease